MASARKHGITDDQMLHACGLSGQVRPLASSSSRFACSAGSADETEALSHGVGSPPFRNPIRVFEFDDLTMLIGADASGNPLEVGVAVGEGVEFIVHAMPAREKFMR